MLLRRSYTRSGSRPCVRQLFPLGVAGLLGLMLSGCGGGSSSSHPTGGGGAGLSHYSYTDLGSIGTTGTHPTGINDAGVIVGILNTSGTGSGPFQPFRHTGETPVTPADALPLPSDTSLGANPVSSSNVNASGVVVGTAFPDNGTSVSVQHAFLYDTSFHDLGTLPLPISGRSVAGATAINDGGMTTGYDSFLDQGLSHAFRHTGTGPLTAADDLGAFANFTRVEASGINKTRLVVGTAMTADGGTRHAFVYDTAFHDLGILPGADTISATGINGSGMVIGYGLSSGVLHSFRHSGTGPLTAADDLGQLPGSSGLAATAVNGNGDVVGNAGQNGGTPTAFVLKAAGSLQSLSDGSLVTNLPPGFGLQIATGINDGGQIVGYTNVLGIAHAWLLTPIP